MRIQLAAIAALAFATPHVLGLECSLETRPQIFSGSPDIVSPSTSFTLNGTWNHGDGWSVTCLIWAFHPVLNDWKITNAQFVPGVFNADNTITCTMGASELQVYGQDPPPDVVAGSEIRATVRVVHSAGSGSASSCTSHNGAGPDVSVVPNSHAKFFYRSAPPPECTTETRPQILSGSPGVVSPSTSFTLNGTWNTGAQWEPKCWLWAYHPNLNAWKITNAQFIPAVFNADGTITCTLGSSDLQVYGEDPGIDVPAGSEVRATIRVAPVGGVSNAVSCTSHYGAGPDVPSIANSHAKFFYLNPPPPECSAETRPQIFSGTPDVVSPSNPFTLNGTWNSGPQWVPTCWLWAHHPSLNEWRITNARVIPAVFNADGTITCTLGSSDLQLFGEDPAIDVPAGSEVRATVRVAPVGGISNLVSCTSNNGSRPEFPSPANGHAKFFYLSPPPPECSTETRPQIFSVAPDVVSPSSSFTLNGTWNTGAQWEPKCWLWAHHPVLGGWKITNAQFLPAVFNADNTVTCTMGASNLQVYGQSNPPDVLSGSEIRATLRIAPIGGDGSASSCTSHYGAGVDSTIPNDHAKLLYVIPPTPEDLEGLWLKSGGLHLGAQAVSSIYATASIEGRQVMIDADDLRVGSVSLLNLLERLEALEAAVSGP